MFHWGVYIFSIRLCTCGDFPFERYFGWDTERISYASSVCRLPCTLDRSRTRSLAYDAIYGYIAVSIYIFHLVDYEGVSIMHFGFSRGILASIFPDRRLFLSICISTLVLLFLHDSIDYVFHIFVRSMPLI